MKKISIIVPVYKVEKYLDRCVDSLVNQTYKNIEIILVDDGSPDNCPQICDKLAKKDNRIKVIHKENGGLSDARNEGIKASKGDYLGFVDSDDYVSLDMYQVLIDNLERNNADISICQYSTFSENTVPEFIKNENNYIFDDPIEVLKKMFDGKIIIANAVWNKLYKKEIFNDVKFPVGINFEDRFVTHKLILNAKRIVLNTSKLYAYMINRKDSIMNQLNKKQIENLIYVSNVRYNDLKDNKEIRKYLNITRARDIYNLHAKVTFMKDKNLYTIDTMINEYKALRKIVTPKSILGYLRGGDIKMKGLKIILLMDRNLFWKIRTRKRKGDYSG